jgi:hypothetical protein
MRMPLTAAQITTLTTDLGTNTNTVLIGGVATAINAITAQQKNSDSAFAVAAWYNLLTATAFYGNYRSVPVSVIRGCIRWKRLTTAESPPASPSTDTHFLSVTNALLSIQENVQMLIGFGGTVDCTQKVIVQGLSDALSAVPSGAAGAAQDAGWSTVPNSPAGLLTLQQSICRLGTNAEKLFADTSGGTGADNTHAATFTFEGLISGTDIQSIWGV